MWKLTITQKRIDHYLLTEAIVFYNKELSQLLITIEALSRNETQTDTIYAVVFEPKETDRNELSDSKEVEGE